MTEGHPGRKWTPEQAFESARECRIFDFCHGGHVAHEFVEVEVDEVRCKLCELHVYRCLPVVRSGDMPAGMLNT
jgi:hypothetical protein